MVIVILGILAAVVVFAVSGVGDKGKASAVTIDERTIRTAEEAYCGQSGRYGSGQELVTAGLLSELPKYHQVGALNTGGNCNGWNYTILKTPQAGTYPQGSWQSIASPPFAGNWTVNELHRLPNGQVLGMFFQTPALLTAIWDPATGAWTQKDSSTSPNNPQNTFPNQSQNNPGAGQTYSSIVLRDDPATPASECGSNCGKVLVHLRGSCPVPFNPACRPWWIFDSNAPTTTQWQPITLDASFEPSFLYQAGAIRLPIPQFKTNCGANCGKVLVTSQDGGRRGYAFFDPRVNGAAAFSASFSYPAAVDPFQFETYTLLPDGRVSLVGLDENTSDPGAFLFDPSTNTWTTDTTPPFMPGTSFGFNSPSRILPTGQVLLAGISGDFGAPFILRHFLYTPVANSPGTWTPVSSGCYTDEPAPAAFGPPFCQALSSLPDGRVLVHGTNDFSRSSGGDYTGKVFAFDPVTQQFSLVADPANPVFFDTVTLDPRFGACGNYCGKVLAVGNQTAGTTQLYTP